MPRNLSVKPDLARSAGVGSAAAGRAKHRDCWQKVRCVSGGDASSGPLVEKHIKRYDPPVPHDDEIPPGVSWHFTRASRYPWNHPCIAIFLRSGSHLIPKVRMSRLDRARDAIDRVAAADGALVRIVEHAIFGPELVDGRAPTRRVVLTEDVVKIADQ